MKDIPKEYLKLNNDNRNQLVEFFQPFNEILEIFLNRKLNYDQ